jgi:hypothetical protein
VAISFAGTDEAVTVDLGPYRYAGGAITRYRLHGATLSAESPAAATPQPLVFRPGEAVLWIFHPPTSQAAPPAVRFVAPRPADTVAGATAVHVVADDPRGVARVELFADDNLITVLRRPPFAVTWAPADLAPGWHALRAVAHGAGGASEARVAVLSRA